MGKEQILIELEQLIEKVENDVMTKGQIEVLLSKIHILQSKLQTIQLQENASNTSKIFQNNRKTSKIARVLAILTIVLSVISLYNAFSKKDISYKSDMQEIRELLNRQIEEGKSLNENLKSLIKNDTLNQTHGI